MPRSPERSAARGDLARYHAKRNFAITAEPRGKLDRANKLRFVVQEHHARRLHYDFRLEWDGVLKSWAVPKGPSSTPGERRLAVEVEDHPLDYQFFEGVIPPKQYGAGVVKIWDKGTWQPEGDVARDLRKGALSFSLRGKTLHGRWTLVRTKGAGRGKKQNQWLLIKRSDELPAPTDDAQPNGARASVGRKAAAPSGAQMRHWRKGKGVVSAAFMPIELAQRVATPPSGADWVHEVKFDGYRLQCHIRAQRVLLLTRRGQDWTARFPKLRDELARVVDGQAVIDGELVAVDARGRTNFSDLQTAIAEQATDALIFYAFDLLQKDARDQRRRPLSERRAALEKLLGKKQSATVRLSEYFAQPGAHVFETACDLGLEGIVSKRWDAPYSAGRGLHWLKCKCIEREEFVIVGYTAPHKGNIGIGALLVAQYVDGTLTYMGRVGTGFAARLERQLVEQLEPRRTETPAAEVPRAMRRGVKWVKPELVCHVEYADRTPAGVLRHAAFKGLREDKPPQDVKPEKPMATPRKTKAKSTAKADGALEAITHPERVVFPDSGITKLEVADYFQKAAERMLPHLIGRPLSLVRCPGGIGGHCFYQKHVDGKFPKGIEMVDVGEGRNKLYAVVGNVAGLLALAQMSTLELHPWGSTFRHLELPDRLIFDLDPGPDVAWPAVVMAAKIVRRRLEDLGLESFLKTTGGKGLHLTVPIKPEHDWKVAKAFCKQVAFGLAKEAPEAFVAVATKTRRAGRIYLDYLRNGRGATAIAPYSIRAREPAPIAMPLTWARLDKIESATVATLRDADKWLRGADPWQGLSRVAQRLSKAALKQTGVD